MSIQVQQCSSAADKGWRFIPYVILPGHRRAPQWVPARTLTVRWSLNSRKAVGGPFGSDRRYTGSFIFFHFLSFFHFFPFFLFFFFFLHFLHFFIVHFSICRCSHAFSSRTKPPCPPSGWSCSTNAELEVPSTVPSSNPQLD